MAEEQTLGNARIELVSTAVINLSLVCLFLLPKWCRDNDCFQNYDSLNDQSIKICKQTMRIWAASWLVCVAPVINFFFLGCFSFALSMEKIATLNLK